MQIRVEHLGKLVECSVADDALLSEAMAAARRAGLVVANGPGLTTVVRAANTNELVDPLRPLRKQRVDHLVVFVPTPEFREAPRRRIKRV